MSILLRCQLCNAYEAKQLHQHLKSVHNVTSGEYRKMFGNVQMQLNFFPRVCDVNEYHSSYVRSGYDKIRDKLNAIDEIYDLNTTITILSTNDFYIKYVGKSKNRTMINDDPVLYKSIKHHCTGIPKKLNLKDQMIFLVKHKGILDNITCKCGNITFTKQCRQCTPKSRICSPEQRIKIRNSVISNIESKRGLCKPNYNKESIKWIDEYGHKNGYNFQHAENGGEYKIKDLGYYLDAYDVDKNVVLEIDEYHHFKGGKLKERDVERMLEIKKHLNCKFIRVKFRKGFGYVYLEL